MMKKMILGIMLVMVSSIVFAGDYSAQTGSMTYTFQKGWNIIPYGDLTDCSNVVRAVFIYSPTQKSYFGAILEAGQTSTYLPSKSAYDLFSSTELNPTDTQLASMTAYSVTRFMGSMWVYTTESCAGKLNIGSITSSPQVDSATLNTFLTGHKLKTGWNFVYVAPWMIGKTLKDMFSGCSVTGFNTWDSAMQNWSQSSSSAAATQVTTQSNGPLMANDVGAPFLVRVSSDCSFTTGSTIVAPPLLPN